MSEAETQAETRLVARVVGVYGNGGISEHRLGTGGGYDNLLI